MHIPIAFQAFLQLLLFFNTLHSSATRLPLVHRDHKLSSPHEDRFEAQMKRDDMRVASLTRRLAANEVSGFETDLQYVAKEYFVEVGVGTPPQNQTLVVDTSSDVSWVKCRCDSCTFDPNNSTSFVDVLCNDTTCYKVDGANYGCGEDLPCTYVLIYADGTEIKGTVAMENITIGNTTVQNATIGCSYVTEGLFGYRGADGILALGGGSLSFASQSGGLIGGVFSYCLSKSAGWLGFGYENVPRDAKWAALVSNMKQPSSYYIDLVEISVGGEVLDIPADTLQVNPNTGEGGMVLDTGTSVTRLAQSAYEALRDKFKEKMGNDFAAVGGVSILDTCYNQGFDPKSVPAVLFNISSRGMDPPTTTLKANNVLIRMNDSTYCLAFAGIAQNFILLGNLQQEGTQITIESTTGYVGFGPDGC